MFADRLTNQAQTTNGAVAFKSTESKVLDLFSNGVSSKQKEDLIIDAITEDPVLAVKTALYLRDVRNGQGNKDILRTLCKVLNFQGKLHTLTLIVQHLPEIGRWKEVIELIGLNKELDTVIFQQIADNIGQPLLAKWLPRQGEKAKAIIKALELPHGQYRRHIAKLSSTVEQQMCKSQWSEINYSAVPSQANKKYAKAFLKNDVQRRKEFLEAATKGEVKVNSSTLYPHQITNMCSSGSWNSRYVSNPTADALWSQLPNHMEQAENVLPIIDLSGSMTSSATGTEGTCMDVAVGLGVYFAERNTGSYKDVWMNFSTRPKAYKLKGNTLSERLKSLDYNNWNGSTNINAAFDMVLSAAIKSPEDAPKMILVVSDMEFNRCMTYQTNFEYIEKQYEEAGIPMPTVVFWRVNVTSKTNPVTMNDKKAVVINGYSATVLKNLLSGDIANYNPYNVMLDIVEPMYPWLNTLKKG